MSDAPSKLPPALPHGPLEQVLPGLYFVTGTMAMAGPMPVSFSRNMTVIVEDDRLILVNTVRLDEAGLAALDALGRVTDVIRIAGFHGRDDGFYRQHYGARVWAMKGHRYTSGLNAKATKTYLEPDVYIGDDTRLPIADATLYRIESDPPEGLLLLARDKGVAIAGDALQNWDAPDQYFSFFGKTMMRFMGFIKPCNVGPGWYKNARPPLEQVRGLLALEFDSLLPAHGKAVIGGAKARFRPAIDKLT